MKLTPQQIEFFNREGWLFLPELFSPEEVDYLAREAVSIYDANRITACLRQNTPQLSGPCRSVFESSDSAHEQAPPRRRNNQPNNPPRTYDNQYRYNQYQ